MSLYGRTDSNADIAKAALALGCAYSNEYDVFFVDETEAQLQENKDRGVTGPGYWAYLSYIDADGNTRHKSELIVTLGGADTNANETQLDDSVLADASYVISISAQPVDTSIVDGNDTFVAVTASVTGGGTVLYQWQRRTSSTGRWVNCSATLDNNAYTGFDSDALTIDPAVLAMDGYEYRVKLTSSNGAAEVISDTAVLTVTAA